jgi:glycine/D-amino acid oxidase-like deaminating enzyme
MSSTGVDRREFSGWIDPPEDLRPPLSGGITCDVAVVGGGLGGMATALRLAERGLDVVLLEADFCGFGSSSRNAGQVAGAPGGDLRMLKLFYRKKMPALVRMAENAAHHVERLMQTHDIDCHYEPNGMVFGAVSRGQMRRVRACAKVLRGAGGHGHVGTSEELGIPRVFLGGMRENLGGMLNPGMLTRGVRRVLLASSARVYEQTRVTGIVRDAGAVSLATPQGHVRAGKVVLATNAYSGEWDITPKRLSIPAYIIEVETEPIAANRLAAMGWTSRSGVVTQHQIMENYRLTERNTIVFGVRRLERGTSYPLPSKTPDPGLVAELVSAFRTRFPALADVRIERSWGGWIAITSSWLSVAGQLEDDVFYSIGCNGHGLAQAPYIGAMIADLIVDGTRPADLDVIWADKPSFAPFFLMGRTGLRLVWVVDRLCDLANGSRRRARRAAVPVAQDGAVVGDTAAAARGAA